MSIHFFSPSCQILANVTTPVAFFYKLDLEGQKKKKERECMLVRLHVYFLPEGHVYICHLTGVWLATHWPVPKACEHHVYVFVLTLQR